MLGAFGERNELDDARVVDPAHDLHLLENVGPLQYRKSTDGGRGSVFPSLPRAAHKARSEEKQRGERTSVTRGRFLKFGFKCLSPFWKSVTPKQTEGETAEKMQAGEGGKGGRGVESVCHVITGLRGAQGGRGGGAAAARGEERTRRGSVAPCAQLRQQPNNLHPGLRLRKPATRRTPSRRSATSVVDADDGQFERNVGGETDLGRRQLVLPDHLDRNLLTRHPVNRLVHVGERAAKGTQEKGEREREKKRCLVSRWAILLSASMATVITVPACPPPGRIPSVSTAQSSTQRKKGGERRGGKIDGRKEG